jgi:diguanylate cyclase (GGDEF)-like protein
MRNRLIAVAAFGGIALVGLVDYGSGVEYRVFPLYFVPLSLAAWHLGRAGAIAAAVAAALSWLTANYLAGMRFSHGFVWVANVTMHTASFTTVGLLIATLRAALQRERQVGRIDGLTHLLNSRAFFEEAERILALERRYRRPVTMVYVDLDNFKHVNDSLGHAGGDDVLRRVAAVLRDCARSSDVTARLGGDEFALLLPETDVAGAAVMLERVRRLLAERFANSAQHITASIGAVSFGEPPEAVEILVQQADAVMYAVKSAGKNRVRVVPFPMTAAPR